MRSAYKPAAPNAGIASQFTIKYYGPGVGELNVGLHHIAMATFYIKNTFEIPDRRLFVMAGSVVEGEVRVGMFLRVAFNSALDMTARIHSIAFARRRGGEEDVCLLL